MVIVRWHVLHPTSTSTWIYCISAAMSSQMVRWSPADWLWEVNLSQCVREVPAHCQSHRKVYVSMTVVSHEVCWVCCYTRETQSPSLSTFFTAESVQRVKSNQAFPFCLGLTRLDSARQPLGGPVAPSTSPYRLYQDTLPLSVNVQSGGVELSGRASRFIGIGPYLFIYFFKEFGLQGEKKQDFWDSWF